MATLLSEIPGLLEAVAKAAAVEDATRRRAFFAGATRIAGIPVLPFTARHFMFLDEAASPLLFGRSAAILPEHVAQFLWVVSPSFVVPTWRLSLARVRRARAAFVDTIAQVRYQRARREIWKYLDLALFDAPRKRHADPLEERPIASLGASFIDEFAAEYGWQPEALDRRGQPIFGAGILDMPLALLLQLRRLMRTRRDPQAYVGNPLSDEAERAAVRRHGRKTRKKGRAK